MSRRLHTSTNSHRRSSSTAPRLAAVVATVALSLTTAFMQPMHAAVDTATAPTAVLLSQDFAESAVAEEFPSHDVSPGSVEGLRPASTFSGLRTAPTQQETSAP